jgi:hypothetical protein
MQFIKPIDYLRTDIASQFGLDKLTWDERIEFVHDNENVLEDGIGLAKKPLLYSKSVHAYREVQAGKPTNFIMGLDASSSCVQIMGLLIGCEKSLIQTNIINTGDVQDVYTNTNTEMNLHLDAEIQVERDKVKKALMTSLYGSRMNPTMLFGEDTPELTQFYAARQTLIPGCMEVMDDLLSAWNPYTTSYQWTLPDGHVAKVMVTDSENTSLRIRDIHGTKSSFTYEYKKRNVTSTYSTPICANVIQSLDAYLCRELIRRCYKSDFNILTVHDCFFCNPNHVHTMRQHYLDICIKLYQSNYLSNIISELLGRPIKYKQYDTSLEGKMRDAEYFIS